MYQEVRAQCPECGSPVMVDVIASEYHDENTWTSDGSIDLELTCSDENCDYKEEHNI